MTRARALFLAAVTTLLVPLAALAQAFEPGDVFVAARTDFTFPGFTFTSYLLWYDRNGTLKGELLRLDNISIAGLAVSPGGTLYMAAEGLSGGGIFSVTPQGATAQEYLPAPGTRALSFAADGTLYTGSFSVDILQKFDIAHNLTRTFAVDIVAHGIHTVDLACNQCTLYFTDLRRLRAFDVCTETLLPDIVTIFPGDGLISGFRVLPDATFLIGHRDGILQYTAQGQLVRQFPVVGLRLALDTDARSVWASAGAAFSKIELATGLRTAGPISTGLNTIEDIAVYAEPRAALASPSAVPIASRWMLLGIALLIATIAVVRLRV